MTAKRKPCGTLQPVRISWFSHADSESVELTGWRELRPSIDQA